MRSANLKLFLVPMHIMRPQRAVGLVSYGGYIPRYRLPLAEVARVWGKKPESQAGYKAVPGPDEDTFTIALAAARAALARTTVMPDQLRAVWVGSESHPYAVKPTGSQVAAALGVGPHALSADFQFACKAGTETLQAGFALVGSGMADYALGIGADTAQSAPGDALDYTAAAGGAAYILGPATESLAVLEGSCSYITDMPDFWRRPEQRYPQHGHRFTGEPAYMHHVEHTGAGLMQVLGYQAADFAHIVLHQPNAKFPIRVAKRLGFVKKQWETGLVVSQVGNTYAGSMLLGLAAVLDSAQVGEKILCVSFGSGAGSDAFILETTSGLAQRQALSPTIAQQLARQVDIDYATYARYTELYHSSS